MIAVVRYQMRPAESFTAPVPRSTSEHALEEGGVLTFGRARRDIRLAGDDPAVSGDAGEIVHVGGPIAQGGHVKVVNNSKTGWIFGFGDRGYNVSIPPYSEFVITQPKTRYLIEGNFGVHDLEVTVSGMPLSRFAECEPEDEDGGGDEPSSPSAQEHAETNQSEAARTLRGKFNTEQKLILNAVFSDFLTPTPVPMPRPQTGEAAAERLRTDPAFRNYPGSARLEAADVSAVVEYALEEARNVLVAGIDQERKERRGAQRATFANGQLHRLALFLLGTGIITRASRGPLRRRE
ncbi:hypothetical protein [Rhodococcus ruber]|uniref:hypothetical protein n=1 Tax=Rhodococcus ruber TaxID=1830 RepID=UPI00265E7A34|nr:hypothetical protein [Rhodococcus ruber]MDO1481590.1 hypothetical protein [Rhodococcus ruber]